MTLPEKRSPAREATRNRAAHSNRPQFSITTRIEPEAFASRLHACGPRVLYELLADLLRGRDLGETLADFGRIDPALYAALAALLLEGSRA
jgi:hypothetical protein